jgi:hypothetical protein
MDCCKERRRRNRDVLGTSRCLFYPLSLRFWISCFRWLSICRRFSPPYFYFKVVAQGCRLFCWRFSYGFMLIGEPIRTYFCLRSLTHQCTCSPRYPRSEIFMSSRREWLLVDCYSLSKLAIEETRGLFCHPSAGGTSRSLLSCES